MTTREKAEQLIGTRLMRELENARLIVVDAIDLETKQSWIEYLEKQLKISKER